MRWWCEDGYYREKERNRREVYKEIADHHLPEKRGSPELLVQRRLPTYVVEKEPVYAQVGNTLTPLLFLAIITS